MFTENEKRRIQAFRLEKEKLKRLNNNLKSRTWYITHGTHIQSKMNEIRRRSNLISEKVKILLEKELRYANALKRKYGLRIYSNNPPTLENVEKALKRHNFVKKTPYHAHPTLLREVFGSRSTSRMFPRSKEVIVYNLTNRGKYKFINPL
jgi:hypothetical protein